jgi:hypothetical protein
VLGALAIAGVALASACPADTSRVRMGQVADPILQELRSNPGKLPSEPAPGTSFVTVRLHADGNGFRFTRGARELPSGSLRFDRARASRLTTPPGYWVLLFDEPVDNVLYWVPLTDPRRVRVEPGGVLSGAAGSALVRLPFEPSGRVGLFESDPADPQPLDSLAFPDTLDSRLDPSGASPARGGP